MVSSGTNMSVEWGGSGWSAQGAIPWGSGLNCVACEYQSWVKIFISLALFWERRLEKVFLLQAGETCSWQH